MKKDLMYYVHKNRKETWRKIEKAAAKSGQSIISVVKNYQEPPSHKMAGLHFTQTVREQPKLSTVNLSRNMVK